MPNFAMRSMILAACLTAVACTDEKASAPEVTPAAPETPAVTASEAVPAPTLNARTTSLDGLNESPLCALDSVNGLHAAEGSFTVTAGQPVTFEGWAAMTNLENPGKLSIILDGQSDFEIGHVTGVSRKDVADAYGSAALENAGFKTPLPALEVPVGKYSVVISHDEAGASVVCKTPLSLVVS